MSVYDIRNNTLRRVVLVVATPIVVPTAIVYTALYAIRDLCLDFRKVYPEVWRRR